MEKHFGMDVDYHTKKYSNGSLKKLVPPIEKDVSDDDDLITLLDDLRFTNTGYLSAPKAEAQLLDPVKKKSIFSVPSPVPRQLITPVPVSRPAFQDIFPDPSSVSNHARPSFKSIIPQFNLDPDAPKRSNKTSPSVTPTSGSTTMLTNSITAALHTSSPTPYSNSRVEHTLLLPHTKKKAISPVHQHKKRGASPMRGLKDDGLEIVGQGSTKINTQSTHNGVHTKAKEDSTTNPIDDLMQNRITEEEFATAIEKQPPEIRWESLRDLGAQFKRLFSLLSFTSSISSELDLFKASEKVAQHVCKSLGAERASLYLIDDSKNALVSKSSALNKRGKAQGMGDISVPLGTGIAGHVAATGETLNIEDAYKEPLFWPEIDKITGYKTKSVLCMPVTDDVGCVVAVLEALNKRKHGNTHSIVPFDADDERLMRTLARHAGISLRNSQLYESSVKSQNKIRILLEVASQLASELETTSLITQIMTKARQLLDADRCTLFLHDAERGELWSKVAEGSKEIRIPTNKGIAGHVVTTGEVLNIKDAYLDKRFNPEIDKRTGYRTKSILCMPLRNNKQQIIGVTQMINKKDGGVFAEQDEALLMAFSAQSAVALENAKLFQKTIQMTNYLQSVLQSITNLVLTLDLDGKFLTSNHPVEEFLGVSEDKIKASTYIEWLGEENSELAKSIATVYADPLQTIEKQDYEFKGRKLMANADAAVDRSLQKEASSLSINYKVVPLLDKGSDNNLFQGVVLIIEDITPQKKMMSTLNRYMSPALAEQVVKEGGDRLGGVHLTVTCLFSDIRGFTPMSEGMDAAEVVGMLNEYFSYMVNVVFDEGGVLDKYIGDAMMAVFGVPFPAQDDPHKACRAALEMLKRLKFFNEKRKANNEQPINIGVGINTGKVLSGNIGSERRLEYTVIGDGVNLASRLESVTKSYGVRVLLSEFTYKEVAKDFVTREIDAIRVVGKQQPIKVYELLGHTEDDVDPGILKMLPFYRSALSAYRERQFSAALGMFQMVAREASDGPSQVFVKRCEKMIKEPPPANWNSVYEFSSK